MSNHPSRLQQFADGALTGATGAAPMLVALIADGWRALRRRRTARQHARAADKA